MVNLSQIADDLIKGQAQAVKVGVQAAIDQGVLPKEILDRGLVAGMSVVGERFKLNQIYIPEVLIAARAMQAGMEILRPLLEGSGVKPIGRVVIGTVKGDLHDIGKNLVAMMLKGAGFEVEDLGIDVHPQQFVQVVKRSQAQIVAMSCLITTSMPSMAETIGALEAAGLVGKVKTMIGGAPVTQGYADEIGADGYAPEASSAVDKAKELLGI